MNVHITNIYGFIQNQDLKKKQNLYADAGHVLGFKEMGIFNFDVTTDTKSELSKRIDGIISSLQLHDLVFIQLPTGNGECYDNLLINKLRAYNTKICVLLHEQIEYEYILDPVDLILPTNDEVYHYLMDNHFTNVFYKKNIHYEFDSNSSGLLSSDFYIKKYLIDAVDQLSQPVLDEQDENVIHIGFGLHDKDGHYSVWVGTAMQSIIDHTDSRICFHILHDDTLSNENKRKLRQVANRVGDNVEFYLISNEVLENVKSQMSRYTIGAMFRCMLPELLPHLEKIIYLDADVYVNRDIQELWNVDVNEYCLAAVKDEGTHDNSYSNILNKYTDFPKEKYFNSGVLVMNLKNIKAKGNLMDMVIEFLDENLESNLPDQDALNILFEDSTKLIDTTWNRFVSYLRYEEKEKTVMNDYVYHFAATFPVLYSECKVDIEYYKTMCRTPWSDYEIGNQVLRFTESLNDRISQFEKMLPRLSESGVKHIFYGHETKLLKKLYEYITLSENDYRVLKYPDYSFEDILPCKSLDALKQEEGPIIIYVLYESDNNTAIKNLEELGFENGKDFFVVQRFMSFYYGGFA